MSEPVARPLDAQAAAEAAAPAEAAPPAETVLRSHVRAENVQLPAALFERSRLGILRHALTPFLFLSASITLARLDVLPLVLAVPVHFVLLLAAHRAFQTQVHDLSHKLFHTNIKTNDWLGNLFAAGWTGTHVQSYRRVHLQHHAYNGSARDPEHVSFEKVQREGGLGRYVLRYVLALHALRLFKKYYGLPSAQPARAPAEGQAAALPRRSLPAALGKALAEKWAVVVAQLCLLLLFGVFARAPWLYLLWVYLAVSWSPMLSGLRFLVEHPGQSDVTITTHAGRVERTFFAPLGFNYHFEHHVWPVLPPYRLRAAHELLRAGGYYVRHPETGGRGFVRPLLLLARSVEGR